MSWLFEENLVKDNTSLLSPKISSCVRRKIWSSDICFSVTKYICLARNDVSPNHFTDIKLSKIRGNEQRGWVCVFFEPIALPCH